MNTQQGIGTPVVQQSFTVDAELLWSIMLTNVQHSGTEAQTDQKHFR